MMNNTIYYAESYAKIQEVIFNESKQTLEVIYRMPSVQLNLVHPPRPEPDQVWKEVYGIGEDGKLALLRTEQGTHIPAHSVQEQIIFE